MTSNPIALNSEEVKADAGETANEAMALWLNKYPGYVIVSIVWREASSDWVVIYK